jgi:hypothetical protein
MSVIVKRRNVSNTGDQGEQGMTLEQQLGNEPAGGVVINIPPTPAPAVPQNEAITEQKINELLEKVRKEEKDKLYPQIEAQKTQLDELIREREERIASAEEQRLAAELEQQRLANEELSTRQLFEQYKSEQELRFEQLEQERAFERSVHEKDLEFQRLRDYRLRRLNEESENIDPRFPDYIVGNTEEEIENSIAIAVQKTNEIAEEVMAHFGQQQQQQRVAPLPVSGMPPTGLPGEGMGDGKTLVFSPDDIRGMSMTEYSKYRDQLTGAASTRVREQGLYG